MEWVEWVEWVEWAEWVLQVARKPESTLSYVKIFISVVPKDVIVLCIIHNTYKIIN